MKANRRKFLKQSFSTAAGMTTAAMMPMALYSGSMNDPLRANKIIVPQEKRPKPKEAIKFGVIGLNHGDI